MSRLFIIARGDTHTLLTHTHIHTHTSIPTMIFLAATINKITETWIVRLSVAWRLPQRVTNNTNTSSYYYLLRYTTHYFNTKRVLPTPLLQYVDREHIFMCRTMYVLRLEALMKLIGPNAVDVPNTQLTCYFPQHCTEKCKCCEGIQVTHRSGEPTPHAHFSTYSTTLFHQSYPPHT